MVLTLIDIQTTDIMILNFLKLYKKTIELGEPNITNLSLELECSRNKYSKQYCISKFNLKSIFKQHLS